MRNLKKILALVLALVMSLSLMATAGASNFTDASSINDKYETAVEVLEGLGVFKGYQEGSSYNFKPDGEITRGEVAAIIYRIATGDVKDENVSIYADYNKFTDVPSTLWSAGYINFCANAEYIKGEGNGKFNPEGKVTGYQALAMILRAIGYTANGGFTGPGWDLQTAAAAEAKHITDNIQAGTLGMNATRQTIAEILFRAILVDMVNYDQRTGYYDLGQSLGYKIFKLEELEGVVVANEFADLYSTQVLAEGKTQLEVAKDDIRTLNYSSTLEDIGESRYVYTQNTSKVLSLGDTGKNTVKETGAATDIRTAVQFQAAAGMPAASDIEYYQNFGRVGTYTCDQRLELTVTFQNAQAEASFDNYAGSNISVIAADESNWTVEATINGVLTNVTTSNANGDYSSVINGRYPARYSKIIRAGEDISSADMAVMEGIFGTADNIHDNLNVWDQIAGDVYVGTYSNTVTAEDRDISNKISFNEFFKSYINDITYDVNWNVSFNGDWVKFIDNDGDGRADYAFVTYSWLDEAVDTYTKNDKTVTEFISFDDNNTPRTANGGYNVRYLDDAQIKVGDKVVCARIDNQILVAPAESQTVTVSSYSWRDDKITTDNGEFGQSGIGNVTDMVEQIDTMDEKVEYVVYLDHFGYVRAYELLGGTKYALITEIYASNNANGNLLKENPLTIELTVPNDSGSVDTKEYNLANASGNPLVSSNYNWTAVKSTVGAYSYYNFLQPAISHLGVNHTANLSNGTTLSLGPVKYTPSFGNSSYTFWSKAFQDVRVINALGMNVARTEISGEFNYGPYQYGSTSADTSNVTTSFTNIGIVNIQDGSTATVNGAAQIRLNKDGSPAWYDTNDNGRWDAGERARYAVDYIQLSTDAVKAKTVRYAINSNSIANYVSDNNNYVNAVDETEYYIVYNGGVKYYKGSDNFPGLSADNNIHAAYAVARDISADNAGRPYWVADVIVYEVQNWNDTERSSVSLAYYTPSRTSGSVQLIKTLNSKYGPMVDLTPGGLSWSASAGQWGADWSGYGFYGLNNDTEPVDNVMTARSIERIRNNVASDGNYGKNDIHAGTVTRETYIANGGEYIDIDITGDGLTDVSVEVTDKVYSVTTGNAQSDNWYGYNEATQLRYSNMSNSQVKAGDRVIWVGDAKTDGTKSGSKFVVDLGNDVPANNITASNINLRNNTPDFLYGWNYDAAGNRTTAQAISNNSNGEWQKIMAEQGVQAPTTGYKVTVKAVSADPSFPTVEDKVVANVLVGSSYTLDSTNAIFNVPGYAISALTSDPATSVGGMTVTLTSTSAQYVGVDRDITITLTYVPTTFTVTGTAGAGVASIVATERNDSNTANTANTATSPAALTVAHGKWVGLTVNLSSALVGDQYVELTLTETVSGDVTTVTSQIGGGMTGSGTVYNYYFTMPTENVTVSARVVGNAYTITVLGQNLSSASSVAATYVSNETVTITAAAGYEITGYTASVSTDPSSTLNGTVSSPMTTGTVVIPAGTNADVSIVVITQKATYTGTITGSATTNSSYSVDTNNGLSGAGNTPLTATPVSLSNLTVDSHIYVLVVGGAAPTVTNAKMTVAEATEGGSQSIVYDIVPDGNGAVSITIA